MKNGLVNSVDEDGTRPLDVLIIGAGFAGIYMLQKLRSIGFKAKIIEAAPEIGGTWYWNCYPGARCDNQSLEYSYSFDEELQQEWSWSEKYASQPEILKYLQTVVSRYSLQHYIELATTVLRMEYIENQGFWRVDCDGKREFSAKFCILATGCLSVPNIPNFEGLDSFQGRVLHTGLWPRSQQNFRDRNVVIFGTGSSSIQLLPEICEEARQVAVLQRTPNYCVPSGNMPMDPDYERSWKQSYASNRKIARESSKTGWIFETNSNSAVEASEPTRHFVYQRRWNEGGVDFLNSFHDLFTNVASNETAAQFIKTKLAEVVHDKNTAALLTAFNHPVGSKRLCCGTKYFESFNRNNIRLIDVLSNPIKKIVPNAVMLRNDQLIEADDIIFATGFDAITGAISQIEIAGRNTERLNSKWANGASTYLGLASHGFPNLFFITGPGSPSVLSNMIVSIEQHVDWISEFLLWAKENGISVVEAKGDAEVNWMGEVRNIAAGTVFAKAHSWYNGHNIDEKVKGFLPYVGGVDRYRAILNDISKQNYSGFQLS